MPTFSVAERRARLARRHLLSPPHAAADMADVARAVTCLHSTDPATVVLSTWARLVGPTVDAMEHALYEERSVVRLQGMRRTLWVAPRDLAPVVFAAVGAELAAMERKSLTRLLLDGGVTDDVDRWIEEQATAVAAVLHRRGQATGQQLGDEVPELRRQVVYAPGTAQETKAGTTTRVLAMLSAEGRILRGRPRGTWVSGQYHWAAASSWLPEGLRGWSVDDGRAELVRRWLGRFGPALATDVKWWTGLTLGQTRKALAAIGAVEVALDEGTGFLLPDDLEPEPPVDPWVALLPGLDPTPMGWQARSWYLGEHAQQVFDRSGNVGPTIWSDGRIVGGWAQRKDGDVVTRLLEDVGAEQREQIAAEAARLQAWLGPVRVTARARRWTPIEQELRA